MNFNVKCLYMTVNVRGFIYTKSMFVWCIVFHRILWLFVPVPPLFVYFSKHYLLTLVVLNKYRFPFLRATPFFFTLSYLTTNVPFPEKDITRYEA